MKRDFSYDVPDGAIDVQLYQEDRSAANLTIGSESGEASLDWDRSANKARVHAWVNGAVGGGNHISWKVIAKLD